MIIASSGTVADLFDVPPLLEGLYDRLEALPSPSHALEPSPSVATELLESWFEAHRVDPRLGVSRLAQPTDIRDLVDGHLHPSVCLSHFRWCLIRRPGLMGRRD